MNGLQSSVASTTKVDVGIPYDIFKSYYFDEELGAEFLWIETRDKYRFERENSECPHKIVRKERVRVLPVEIIATFTIE
jgi:hypothetical protein